MCPTVVGYIIAGKAGQGLEAASHTSSQEQREDACMHACLHSAHSGSTLRVQDNPESHAAHMGGSFLFI